jgi:flagella synthesis protein FlgN
MSPLLAHVLAETSCIQGLLASLDQEDKAISECRFAELPSITEQKARLLDRMAQLDQDRECAQVAFGFEPGRAGADAAAAAGDDTLRRAWASMLALAGQARDLNHRVGARVYTHLDFTQRAIGFLQARDQPTYGPDGVQKAQGGGGSSLALG